MNMDVAYFISFSLKKEKMIQKPRKNLFQSRDRLALLTDGTLRHYIRHPDDDDSDAFIMEDEKDGENMLHDYAQGKYCMDKVRTYICNERNMCSLAQ